MYLNYYRLKRKPFQLLPDTEFFYNSPVHKRALAYLQYGLEQGDGFVVITGYPGTGKTMLVRELFDTLSPDVLPILLQTSNLDATNILVWIANSLGLETLELNKASLLDNLENHLRVTRKQNKRVLLVVDEAQNLPVSSLEELRMLLNLEFDGLSLFQVFLIGQDELKLMLQSDNLAQVRQRISATYHLRPLDLVESKSYILHRLTTAGWDGFPSFQDQIFNIIHDFTNGIPRIINLIFDRLLLYGFLEEKTFLDVDAINLVISEYNADEISNVVINKQLPLVQKVNSEFEDNINSAQQPYEDLTAKLLGLQREVEYIKSELSKEKALLRKAILIQLDMTHVFEDPKE